MRLLLFLVLIIAGFEVYAQNDRDAILQIMERQQDCWNSGDLECFMEGYWESDSLMFVSSSQVYYGYDQTLNRYRSTYPDRAVMGRLKFEFITLEKMSDTTFFMVGKYHLEREMGDKQGHFTLLWRKINGSWVIVVDHSS
jgi:ketosteroid isomerase-like protein